MSDQGGVRDKLSGGGNGESSNSGGGGSSSRPTTRDTVASRRRPASGSRTLAGGDLNNILCKYLFLELGKIKKEEFNLPLFSQSTRVSENENRKKLLKLVLHAQEANTRLEVNFGLTCLGGKDDQSNTLPNSLQTGKENDDKNKSTAISIGPLYLQSSQLEESNFKDQFFVTRNSFQVICSHLMQEYGSTAYKRTEVDVEKQLLVTLTYLSTFQSYKEIASKFSIAISTAHRCVNDVTNTLFKRMGELVYWPIDNQADSEIQAFNEMPGNKFPGIIGVIGTVDLKKTSTANPSKHTKDRTSIAIQCVCNNRYQFYNVFTSYLSKSSVTTSTFLESPLAEKMLNDPDALFPTNNTHIVGPCCYPLLPNLMTPFCDDPYNTAEQNAYNEAINVPLNIIKLAFGKLLGRFKRLMCLDLWGQEKFSILIFAACCLHNICLGNSDDIHCQPYECCTFKCDYYDEFSVGKRQKICNKLSFKTGIQESQLTM